MFDKLTKKGLVNRLGGSVYIWSGSEIILHVTGLLFNPQGGLSFVSQATADI